MLLLIEKCVRVVCGVVFGFVCFFFLILPKFLASVMKCDQQFCRLPVHCLGTHWNWFHFFEYPIVLALQSWMLKESRSFFSVLSITLCISFMCPYIYLKPIKPLQSLSICRSFHATNYFYKLFLKLLFLCIIHHSKGAADSSVFICMCSGSSFLLGFSLCPPLLSGLSAAAFLHCTI